MKEGKRYSPPDCPTYFFFLGRSFEPVMVQNLLKTEEDKVKAGIYHVDADRIQPISQLKVAHLGQLCRESPEMIVASPLENASKPESPLIMGDVKIYPNWRYFSIEGIGPHPLYTEGVYITQIGATSAELDYGVKTKDRKTGQHRVEFVGSSEPFDPISMGLLTWRSYIDLHTAPSEEELHLLLHLTPGLIKEIRRLDRRGKGSDDYSKFLERIKKLATPVEKFIGYLDGWAQRHAKRK